MPDQEPVTPEALAAELDSLAGESVLKARSEPLRVAAARVRKLTPAWDVLTAERDQLLRDAANAEDWRTHVAEDRRAELAERDRYRKALEAIAASDGTCGEKARKALEAQS